MVVCGKDGGVFDMLDVFCEFCFWLRHMREHEFRGGAMTFVLRHSNILHYSFWSIITGKTRLNFKMPFSDNHGQNYWDNRLKITPEIKFPSEQSKSPPPNNVDDNLHQPLFAFNFFQPTLDRGRGGWHLFGQSCELWRPRSFVHRCPNDVWPGL